MKSNELGVVVVRLQVPSLHDGHLYLLNAVTAIHKRVLVILGESDARLTLENPLSYTAREQMLKQAYPDVDVAMLRDVGSDKAWSEDLDTLIWMKMHDRPMGDGVVLYGGRDSFLSHYHGRYRTFELPPADPMSGTEMRAAVRERNSEDFRAGMIFAAKHKWPVSYQCVDVAVMNTDGRILVGQKKGDNGKWRFIGGFVSTDDPCLEAAAMREVREETGLEPGDMHYIGSEQVDDYRYPKDGRDRLMTAFFRTTRAFGAEKAADDIVACKWMRLEELNSAIVPQHLGLLEMLEENLKGDTNAE